MRIERILVAIDFSPHSEKALKHAIGLAKSLDAELHLVHAYHVALPVGPPNQVAVPPQFWTDIREAADRRLQETLRGVEAEGIQCVGHLTAMSPAPGISETADEVEADLIVMGTRGNTGLRHVLLGSVAERTLRLSNVPVLTVKADEA
jgi:nucleotide-binding universal stress UspA family protein